MLYSVHDQSKYSLAGDDARLASMFDSSPAFMAVLSGPDFVFERVNEQYSQLVGRGDLIGRPLVDVLPEAKDQGFLDLLKTVNDSGQPYVGVEVPFTLHRQGEDQPDIRYLDFVYQAHNHQGSVAKIFVHGTDVTEKVISRKFLEQAKNTILNERDNFRNLFMQTPEMVCILAGPEHVFEFVNEAHIRALGFDATGKPVRVAQPESVEVHGILDDVYRTGKTAELIEIPVTLGNRLRFFNLTYAARFDTSGHVNGVMILGTEVTEQVLNRESIASQRLALELTLKDEPVTRVLEVITLMLEQQIGEGVRASASLVDDARNVLVHGAAPSMPDAFNDAMNDLPINVGMASCGTAAQLAKPIIAADISKDLHWHSRSHLALAHGLRACWSTPILSSRGKVLGTIALYYTNVHTPTSREQHLLELAIKTVALVIERQTAVSELRNARDEAESARQSAEMANESKTRFLANISHEIRTPLAAIFGFTELLRSPNYMSKEDTAEHLDRIARNAMQLGRLIDDMLDLSKIEAERFEIECEDFDLHTALQDVLASVSLKAKEKLLDLELRPVGEVPQLINTDLTRLKQILINIIGNAIKFTDHGQVQVAYSIAKTAKENLLSIRVKDTGIGLTVEQQRRIFARFVQGDSSVTRKYGGTGLGLVLSKRLTQLMGGDLILEEATLGQGCTFLIQIKLNPVQSATVNNALPHAPIVVDGNTLNGLSILVVDDARDNQMIIRLFIERAHGQVTIAENGLVAVEKMKQTKFDMVLMDIQMPIMDGYQALRVARELGYAGPIVALTAHALTDEKNECLESGFTDYLSKPVDRDALVRRIYTLCHT